MAFAVREQAAAVCHGAGERGAGGPAARCGVEERAQLRACGIRTHMRVVPESKDSVHIGFSWLPSDRQTSTHTLKFHLTITQDKVNLKGSDEYCQKGARTM